MWIVNAHLPNMFIHYSPLTALFMWNKIFQQPPRNKEMINKQVAYNVRILCMHFRNMHNNSITIIEEGTFQNMTLLYQL